MWKRDQNNRLHILISTYSPNIAHTHVSSLSNKNNGRTEKWKWIIRLFAQQAKPIILNATNSARIANRAETNIWLNEKAIEINKFRLIPRIKQIWQTCFHRVLFYQNIVENSINGFWLVSVCWQLDAHILTAFLHSIGRYIWISDHSMLCITRR